MADKCFNPAEVGAILLQSIDNIMPETVKVFALDFQLYLRPEGGEQIGSGMQSCKVGGRLLFERTILKNSLSFFQRDGVI